MAARLQPEGEQGAYLQRLNMYSSIAGVGMLVFLLVRLLHGNVFTAWILTCGLVLVAASKILIRGRRYPELGAHTCLCACLLVLGLCHLQDGMHESMSLWMLPAVPVAAGHLLGRRASVIYWVLAIGMVLLAQGEYLPIPYPPRLENQWIDWFGLRLIVLVAFTAIAMQSNQDMEQEVAAVAETNALIHAAHQDAQRLDAEKSRFLQEMAQEIRAPMNGIKGMTQYWSRLKLEGELHESVQVMDRCADNLLGMIRDIQDLSKIEQGEFPIEVQPCSIGQIVEDVAKLFVAKAASKGVTLRVQGPEQDCLALTDGKRLTQVLSNLVGNAIKFSDGGSVVLAWEQDSRVDGRWLVFSVCDQGIGMSDSQLARLFQEFEQVNLDQGSLRGGTGLGLTISKGLVEAMRGYIDVESALGQGSTFRVSLPYQPAKALATARKGLQPSRLGGRRVLLVEDDPVNMRVQLLALASLGCTVRGACLGQLAIDLAQTHPFDLIVLDLKLPDLSGAKVAQGIRGSVSPNANAPILLLTASTLQTDHEQCLAAGADAVLLKPFTYQELSDAMLGLLAPAAAAA